MNAQFVAAHGIVSIEWTCIQLTAKGANTDCIRIRARFAILSCLQAMVSSYLSMLTDSLLSFLPGIDATLWI